MSEEGAPPQIIRRADGSFHVLNVDLSSLSKLQRLAVGIQVWDQTREILEASGEFKPATKVGWSTTPGVGEIEDVDRYVAVAVGIAHSQMNLLRPRLLKRPDVVERVLAGEFASSHALQRELGFKLRVTLEEGAPSQSKLQTSYFGKSDKFLEATEPLVRYLNAWGKQGFRFTHVPPREAQRRVERIEQLIQGLTQAKEDLAERSHVASYAVSSRKKGEVS